MTPDCATLHPGYKLLSSNRRIKLADEHDRENGRKQRQQSFVPRAHDKITPAGTRGSSLAGRERIHRASAEVEGSLARVSERVPLLGVHNSNKTSTTAVAKMPAMVQIDGFCFWPYIATSL
jgi:hypothetical protein